MSDTDSSSGAADEVTGPGEQVPTEAMLEHARQRREVLYRTSRKRKQREMARAERDLYVQAKEIANENSRLMRERLQRVLLHSEKYYENLQPQFAPAAPLLSVRASTLPELYTPHSYPPVHDVPFSQFTEIQGPKDLFAGRVFVLCGSLYVGASEDEVLEFIDRHGGQVVYLTDEQVSACLEYAEALTQHAVARREHAQAAAQALAAAQATALAQSHSSDDNYISHAGVGVDTCVGESGVTGVAVKPEESSFLPLATVDAAEFAATIAAAGHEAGAVAGPVATGVAQGAMRVPPVATTTTTFVDTDMSTVSSTTTASGLMEMIGNVADTVGPQTASYPAPSLVDTPIEPAGPELPTTTTTTTTTSTTTTTTTTATTLTTTATAPTATTATTESAETTPATTATTATTTAPALGTATSQPANLDATRPATPPPPPTPSDLDELPHTDFVVFGGDWELAQALTLALDTPTITVDWLADAARYRSLPMTEPYTPQPRPLRGLYFMVMGSNFGGVDYNGICESIVSAGGRIGKSMQLIGLTHVLVAEEVKIEKLSAIFNRGIPVVTKHYVNACIASGRRVKDGLYALPSAALTRIESSELRVSDLVLAATSHADVVTGLYAEATTDLCDRSTARIPSGVLPHGLRETPSLTGFYCPVEMCGVDVVGGQADLRQHYAACHANM